jgi:hypothetical protein
VLSDSILTMLQKVNGVFFRALLYYSHLGII